MNISKVKNYKNTNWTTKNIKDTAFLFVIHTQQHAVCNHTINRPWERQTKTSATKDISWQLNQNLTGSPRFLLNQEVSVDCKFKFCDVVAYTNQCECFLRSVVYNKFKIIHTNFWGLEKLQRVHWSVSFNIESCKPM